MIQEEVEKKRREFLQNRGWKFVEEPLYTKEGHGSRERNIVYGHREYAVKGGDKLSVKEAWEYERDLWVCGTKVQS